MRTTMCDSGAPIPIGRGSWRRDIGVAVIMGAEEKECTSEFISWTISSGSQMSNHFDVLLEAIMAVDIISEM